DRGPPAKGRPIGRGRMRPARSHVRVRADVLSGRRERGGVRPPQGRHGHPHRGGPEPARDRRVEGRIPWRPEGHAEPGRTPEELRTPEPRDEGALGRPQRGRRFSRLPGARRARLPGRGFRVPRGPGDLERRVPGEDARGADGVCPHAGSEELPSPRGPRPPIRASVVDFYGGKEKLQDHFEGWYVKY